MTWLVSISASLKNVEFSTVDRFAQQTNKIIDVSCKLNLSEPSIIFYYKGVSCTTHTVLHELAHYHLLPRELQANIRNAPNGCRRMTTLIDMELSPLKQVNNELEARLVQYLVYKGLFTCSDIEIMDLFGAKEYLSKKSYHFHYLLHRKSVQTASEQLLKALALS